MKRAKEMSPPHAAISSRNEVLELVAVRLFLGGGRRQGVRVGAGRLAVVVGRIHRAAIGAGAGNRYRVESWNYTGYSMIKTNERSE